jgi:hypothetical protein
MATHIEPTYMAAMPCRVCNDPEHIRPGGWGWKATDTYHPGLAGSPLESAEAAESALRGAIAHATALRRDGDWSCSEHPLSTAAEN